MENEKINFKNRALVREGDVLYYGNLDDSYILRLRVLEGIDLGDIKLSSTVRAELLDIKNLDSPKIIKTTERDGLYQALEIGEIWVSRMISEDD